MATNDDGGPKYSVGARTRARWDADRPRLTDHALERWDERMPVTAQSPEWALDHAASVKEVTRLPFFAERQNAIDDLLVGNFRTRTGERYRPVCLVRNEKVLTCYPIRMLEHAPLRAYLHARADVLPCHGGADDD